MSMKDTIKPAVLVNGRTIYPTGFEWLLAFAIKGCKWAEDALPEAVENYNKDEIEKTLGSEI
jgi:hypothetical protein